MRDARDWNISRNRYWGTPLPIWASEDGEELVVIGSIAELEELTGEKVTDIHMDSIDHLTIPSKQGKGLLKRIPDVFDCWFESGSMPYAQVHYPFENKEIFEKNFPADFIAEGIDQTRGWFYTLLVLSTALFNKPPFKNLIVNGLVLAADGKKMSKSLKNYPDPMIVIDKYGADALRLYLINSPVVRAEELKFKEEGVLQNLKDIFIPWFHAYRFFVQNTLRCESTKGWKFDRNGAEAIAKKSENIMDRWIMAASHGLIKFVHQEMEAYRLYTVVPDLIKFIENLCNWYVKLNRTRMTGLAKLDASEEEQLEDTKNALSTMYTVLVTLSKLMAPFTPYFAEYLYQHLVQPQDEKEASVHFLSMPSFDQSLVNPEIEKNFNNMAEIINMNRLIRGNDIPVRRPLRELIIVHESEEILNKLRDVEHYIKGESNVWKVTFSNDEKKYCLLSAKLNGSAEKDGVKLGKRLGKKMGVINKAVAKLTHEQISNFQEAGTITIEDTVLEISDVFINRQPIIEKKSSFKGKVGLQSNLTILLDTTVDAETISGQISRDFVNRIQKQRKTSGLQVGDVVDIFYSISGGSPEDVKEIENALEKNSDSIRTILKRPIQKLETKPSQTEVLGESSAPIGTFHSETNGTEEASITVVIATPSV